MKSVYNVRLFFDRINYSNCHRLDMSRHLKDILFFHTHILNLTLDGCSVKPEKPNVIKRGET